MSEIWFQRFVITSLFFAYLINGSINQSDFRIYFLISAWLWRAEEKDMRQKLTFFWLQFPSSLSFHDCVGTHFSNIWNIFAQYVENICSIKIYATTYFSWLHVPFPSMIVFLTARHWKRKCYLTLVLKIHRRWKDLLTVTSKSFLSRTPFPS